jgi:hypothetical protein
MKKTFSLSAAAAAAALAVVAVAAPAQAFGSGVDGCNLAGSTMAFQSSTLHQATVYACVGVDNSIQSTAKITNTGAGATYSITAELHRASDGALVAWHNCQAVVPAGDTYYCTKAWPRSNTTVYTRTVVNRGSVTPAFTLQSNNKVITA